MAEVTMMGASTAAASEASSYHVKFDRENFIELVRLAKPKIIYRRKTCTSLPTTLRNVLRPM